MHLSTDFHSFQTATNSYKKHMKSRHTFHPHVLKTTRKYIGLRDPNCCHIWSFTVVRELIRRMRVAGGHASPRRRRFSIPIGKRRRPSPHNPPISLIPQPPIPIQSHSTSSYLTSEYWVAFPGGFPGGFCCPTRGDESKALAISSIGGLYLRQVRTISPRCRGVS